MYKKTHFKSNAFLNIKVSNILFSLPNAFYRIHIQYVCQIQQFTIPFKRYNRHMKNFVASLFINHPFKASGPLTGVEPM